MVESLNLRCFLQIGYFALRFSIQRKLAAQYPRRCREGPVMCCLLDEGHFFSDEKLWCKASPRKFSYQFHLSKRSEVVYDRLTGLSWVGIIWIWTVWKLENWASASERMCELKSRHFTVAAAARFPFWIVVYCIFTGSFFSVLVCTGADILRTR